MRGGEEGSWGECSLLFNHFLRENKLTFSELKLLLMSYLLSCSEFKDGILGES